MPGLPSLLLVVPLLLTGYSSALAQGRQPRVKRATWLTLGVGLGPQFGTEVATAAVGAISHQARSLILSLSGASAVSGGTSVQSIGILAGAGTPPKARHVSLEIGLARVSGNHTSAAVIGVPVQAQVGLRTRVIGIGVLGYANVNSYHTFGAVAVALQVGKLW